MQARAFIRTALLSVAVFATAVVLFAIDKTPSYREIRAQYEYADQVVVDRNGLILDEIRTSGPVRRLGWVTLKDVPADFLAALLMAEDRRFFYHFGFDPMGSETITMQVADFIWGPTKLSKLSSLALALLLEIKWRKSEIIEAYLNMIPFRVELQGLQAASYGLFDKPPARLKRTESALLVAVRKATGMDSEEVRIRACELLRRLGSPEDCGLLTREHLGYLETSFKIQPFPRWAPHLADQLVERSIGGGEPLVRTTLDRRLQWIAIHGLQKRGAEGAVVILDNPSGDVLAFVGHEEMTRRHPVGAALSPLIFAGAIDERILTVSSRLEDSPRALAAVTQGSTDALYRNRRQPVSTARSLIYRLKIPALLALELLGVDNFVQTLDRLGFRDLGRPGSYGPSLALGSAEVNLFELTNAYRTLANGGIGSAARFSLKENSDWAPVRVFSPATAFIVKDLLSRRLVDPRDQWSIGHSGNLTVGVWTKDPAQAESVFRDLLRRLPKGGIDTGSSSPPEGLVREGGQWYLTGTEPRRPTREWAQNRSHFSFPRDQAMLALKANSLSAPPRFYIQVVAPQSDQNVYLNGRRLGRAASFLPWHPVPGRHLLELRDSKGIVLDRVTFEARGRSFASAW